MKTIQKYSTPTVLLILAVLITALVITVGVAKADADDEPTPTWPTEPMPEPVDGTPEQQGIEQGYPDEGEIGEGIVEYAPLPDTGA